MITKDILHNCMLCPHHCMIDRTEGNTGFCNAKEFALISSAMAHHGEEPPISGTKGSGTIFFSNCNMRCVYCQNYQISQYPEGDRYTDEGLSALMLDLENKGCHNINLVSPTIWLANIVESLDIARSKGLSIPIVYNTGGYEDPEIIKSLDGLIDIYMPDMRYSDDGAAKKYSEVSDYVKNNRGSIKEMYKQVGPLRLDGSGIAIKGLMIRLLVLPDKISGIKDTLDFLSTEISTDTYLSIMAQYHPRYKASDIKGLNRQITLAEYSEVTEYAAKLGFENGWTQDHVLSGENDFVPDFNDEEVFKFYKKDK